MIDVTWYSFRLDSGDNDATVTAKLIRKKIDLLDVPQAVYVIRLASTFLIEYKQGMLSPVVYIGQGRLRQRLRAHTKWLSELQRLLPHARIEVKVCFPKGDDLSAVHRQYEAHLLARFKKQFGQLPLRNRKREIRADVLEFSKVGRQQALGPGTGKKYAWSVKPLPESVRFTKFQVQ